MITVSVKEIRSFMRQLLLTETFDSWGFQGAEISALTKYTIGGTPNPRYLTEEEKAQERSELSYCDIRPILSAIVRAGRTPTQMKVVLSCPKSLLGDHVSVGAESYLLSVHFQNGECRLTAGISMRAFSMDRSDAVFWDQQLPKILQSLHIAFDMA